MADWVCFSHQRSEIAEISTALNNHLIHKKSIYNRIILKIINEQNNQIYYIYMYIYIYIYLY